MTRADWTEEQAIDLLTQGYDVKQAAKITGYKAAWLRKQRVPQEPLRARLAEKLAE